MFDFLFGGKRKLAFIRELLEQRREEIGYRSEVRGMGKLQLLSTPEGTIVTIIETIIGLQKRGMLLHQILSSIENYRKRTGHNHNGFDEILKLSMGDLPGASVPAYCNYRILLEHHGCLTDEEVENIIEKTVLEMRGW